MRRLLATYFCTVFGFVLGAGMWLAPRTMAQTYSATNTWTGASDLFWPTPGNWSPAVPTASSLVLLTNTGSTGLPGTNGSGAVGTPNIIVSNDTSVASMYDMHTNLFGPSTLYHTIQISNGVTLTISNNPTSPQVNVLQVISQSGAGAPSNIGADYGANAVIYNTIQGSGRLAIIATNGLGTTFARGNIFVGQGSGGTGGALSSVLDLSGLDTFDADVNHILLGDGGVAGFFINRPVGTLYFAKTNNLRLWAVGNHPSAGANANGGLLTGISAQNGDNSRSGRYVLGYTNVILCNSGITFGSRGFGGWLGFNPSNAPGASAAYFRNLLNTGRQTRWSIGDRLGAGNGASQPFVPCELDFSGGTVDALVGTLTIGVNSQVSGLIGKVAFGAGTIDVNTLQMGVQSASSGYAQGSLTVSNSGVLRVNTSGTLGGAVGTLLPNYFARLIVTNGGTAIFSNTAPITCGVGARTEIYVANGSGLSVYTVGSSAAPLSYLQLSGSTLTVDRGTASNPTTGGILFANELDLSGANTINMLGSVLVVGQFPIIKYSSIVNGGFANLTLGTTSPTVEGYLSNNVANSSIDFVVTNSSTVTLTWDGQTNSVPIGNWDINVTPNWQGGLKYLQPSVPGSLVVFDDTATGTTTVTPTNNSVAPAVFTVNNTIKNYVFGGTNISGPTALLKNGTGLITLASSSQNTFSGGVFVNDGTLIAGTVNSLPSTILTVGNLATAGIDLNNLNQNIGVLSGGGGSGGNLALGSANLTLSSGSASYGGVISGTGRLIKTGSGTQTLTAANLYSGGTFITNAGVLVAADNGLGTGPIFVSTNGTLQLGNGSADGLMAQPFLTNISGTLSVFPASSYTFTNQIVSTNGSFIKLIGNTTALSITNGNPNMTGPSSIQQGSIVISHPTALGTGSITVGNVVPGDCFLGLANGINVTNPITLSGKTGAVNPSPVGINSVSGTNALHGNITLNGSTIWSIGTESGSKLIINSAIVNSGPVGSQQLNLRGLGEGVMNKPLPNGAGTLTVTKEDAGQWTLTATNTYSGPTLVNAGSLMVHGALTGGGSVTVLPGAVLGGRGYIKGAVTNSGLIDISGDGVLGTLTVSNALLSDGVIAFDVSTNGNDRIRGLTTFVMDGGLKVVLNGTLPGNAIFKLFDATNYVGTFASYDLPDITPLTWDSSQLTVDGTLRAVGAAVVTPAITSISANGTGGFLIAGTGTLVAPFDILASTNVALPLVNWLNIGSGTFSNGYFLFNDVAATNYHERFYLLTTPSP